MTPVFVAALLAGWILVSFVACLAVCMASARFSARVEELRHEQEFAPRRPAPARRARQPIAVRMESHPGRVKVKVS